MTTQRFIYDQFGTAIRSMHVDTATGSFTTQLSVDCEPVIEQNKAERDQITGKEIFRKAATVPVHVAEQAFREGWFHDDKAWAKWLNDPENRDFRVWEGRI